MVSLCMSQSLGRIPVGSKFSSSHFSPQHTQPANLDNKNKRIFFLQFFHIYLPVQLPSSGTVEHGQVDPFGTCDRLIHFHLVSKKRGWRLSKLAPASLIHSQPTTQPRWTSDWAPMQKFLSISTYWAYELAAKRAKNLVCVVHTFQLSFHFACHRWWLGFSC